MGGARSEFISRLQLLSQDFGWWGTFNKKLPTKKIENLKNNFENFVKIKKFLKT